MKNVIEKEKDLEDQPKVSEILTNRNFRRQNRKKKKKEWQKLIQEIKKKEIPRAEWY